MYQRRSQGDGITSYPTDIFSDVRSDRDLTA